ncbi:PREDICTED: LOW QUALITY PROTEIN: cell surface glycoprotein gp42-like [Nanorana parkeri]|uniref:LOW QUALITY PROTEIN: cell surface glycoprotein gp42-like n=1 Tax=Nanorana parkeri TaxID=125878 RepID=UPI000854E98F|nr:PREDICTED: LOW QUALITY PROTEIN: cell surface glycoprotein gp42-like [Nanorana parkeri]
MSYDTFNDEDVINVQKLFAVPEITVTPKSVVEGDHMTLTCDTRLSPLRPRTELKFAFYRDGRNVGEFSSSNRYGVQSAQVKDSGKYSCEVTTNSVQKRSQEIKIQINAMWPYKRPKIIRNQYPEVEGDHMTLTCDTSLSPLRPGTQLQFAFYRDGRNVQEFGSSNQYGVQSAQLEDSGNYSCDVRTSDGKARKSSHFLPIVIKGEYDLFERPKIIRNQYPEVEGDHMTLTCDTSLSPLRPGTQLQFAFYRDGRNVQEFGSSNQYGVQSAQLEDSGNYSCDVRTSDGKARKSSHFLPIVIKDYRTMNVVRLVLSFLVLCLTCGFLIHHVKTNKDHDQLEVEPEDLSLHEMKLSVIPPPFYFTFTT